MPRRGVAIVGADAMGKANDKEVSGDADEVTQRRSEVVRRRTVAIQALLDEIKPVGKPAPVPAAALAADRTAVQKKGGIERLRRLRKYSKPVDPLTVRV